jgi:hypothetical protein
MPDPSDKVDLNKIFTATANLFNSGWIPLLGWTCGFLILAYYMPQIIIATIVWGKAAVDMGSVPPFPIKSDDLMNLVYLLITSKVYNLIKK